MAEVPGWEPRNDAPGGRVPSRLGGEIGRLEGVQPWKAESGGRNPATLSKGLRRSGPSQSSWSALESEAEQSPAAGGAGEQHGAEPSETGRLMGDHSHFLPFNEEKAAWSSQGDSVVNAWARRGSAPRGPV